MKISITQQSGQSLTDRIARIEAALRKRFKTAAGDAPLYWYPREVFDESVISTNNDDGKLYRIPYTVDGEEVTFGEPVEVEEEYVEVRQSGLLRIRQSLSADNLKWRFQVVGWGLSTSRHVWQSEVFAQSLEQYDWENLDAYLDHPSKSEEADLPERSVQKKVGWWSDFEVTPTGMDATLNLKPSAAWIGADIKAAFEAGNRKLYAASINVLHRAKQVTWTDGKPATEPVIVKPISIDLVTVAAANGRVKHALASVRESQNSEGENRMIKELLLALLAGLTPTQFATVRQSLVTSGAQGVTLELTPEQLADTIHADEALVTQARQAVAEAAKETPAPPNPAQPARQAATPAAGDESELPWERLPQSLRRMALQQEIANSDLPEAVQQSLRKKVTDATTLTQLQATIEATRDGLATMTQAGLVNNPRAEVGADRADKISVALAKSFGLGRDEYNQIESSFGRYCRQAGGGLGQIDQDTWNSIERLPSIRQLYLDLTGDHGFTGRGGNIQRITRQATWVTSDFTELMANVFNKRLLRDFRGLDQTWRRIAVVRDVRDFKTQYAILVGEFGDLPGVSQQDDYLEPSALTDTQESYAVTKRGRIISMSWETIVNDDLDAFVRTYGKLGRAAARTLLKFVWNTLFMSNPTLAVDSKALFHVDHNNLITLALGTPGLKAAITALLNQTEPGSGEKMNVDTMNLTLAVSPSEYLTAQTLTDFNNAPGGETDALSQVVRRMGITPVAVPFFSDPDDWTLICSPQDREVVEIGFLNGNEEPEFFTQNDPTQGDYFLKDTVAKYKIRHVYSGAPVDFRGAVKSVVTA